MLVTDRMKDRTDCYNPLCICRRLIGGASACTSVATVRSSKSRFAIDEYTVRAIYTGHVQQRSSPWRCDDL